eukprot:1481006-Pyramimonas_sp.AAC.1
MRWAGRGMRTHPLEPSVERSVGHDNARRGRGCTEMGARGCAEMGGVRHANAPTGAVGGAP